MWRDAPPKRLRDEAKAQRPVGCSRYVTGFERCSPRVDGDIELARGVRGAHFANKTGSPRQHFEVPDLHEARLPAIQ